MIEIIDAPQLKASVLMSYQSSKSVFREDEDITPLVVSEKIKIMPWGADNQLPYDVMELVDGDETTSACMEFNTEVTYGAGLEYDTEGARRPVIAQVENFMDASDIQSLFIGQCADMKMFNFCVTALILSPDGRYIDRAVRKEAAYCRFMVHDKNGRIPAVVYANWRNNVTEKDCEVIPLLGPGDILTQLRAAVKNNPKQRIYAVVSRVPKASSTYYPIPAYASIFRSHWYDIKNLIGKAKKAKLKNSAPIKYHIEVADGYFDRACQKAGISDPLKKKEFITKMHKEMIDFLTGAENSGKVLFSTTFRGPDGKEIPEIKVTKISSNEKEGGDYTTDIQEAVNMICFAMRVHSNLVGSVPGKSQSNNSGSDKRELYTIAQTLQRPYHRLMLMPHRLICRYNGWKGVTPYVDIIQLTTLDTHADLKQSSI